MQFAHADLFVPGGGDFAAGLEGTSHLGVVAHQDDLEIVALHGIGQCIGVRGRKFCGVVVTDGRGSPRSGPYAGCTDEEMARIRREEQRRAAVLGRYGAVAQLGWPSGAVKAADSCVPVVEELAAILAAARPRVVYTHNPADRHPTHVAVALRVIAAIRRLPEAMRPEAVYGGEVWRGLDWLPAACRVALDVSPWAELQAQLLREFDSQIAGGKRYDLAAVARNRANATYDASHGVDAATHLAYAMDLSPLVREETLRPEDFLDRVLAQFNAELREAVRA
jgi:LmbE family N-acetylglucosaminyl deacetylase